MTPEQLEKGKTLTNNINEITRLIQHSEKPGVYIRPGFAINDCVEARPIPVSQHAKSAISALVMADLKSQLESLQKEFDAL